MDPYEFHLDADYDRVASLTELAGIVGAADQRARDIRRAAAASSSGRLRNGE